MKKLLYLLFTVSVISCGNEDNTISENPPQITDLSPDKALVHYMEFPKVLPVSPSYFRFDYENDRLIKMMGKLQKFSNVGYLFSPEPYRSLTYNDNKVELKSSDNPYTNVVYTMENGKLKKSELFTHNVLQTTKIYTYENNKIIVYEDTYNKNREAFTSYFFDSNKNLIKSEKLEKSGGFDHTLTTINYSNFDNAKNPFKKLSLINDNLYEKSLSANNFRKREAVIQYIPTAANGNIQLPPGIENSTWTYQYDSNGQVLLYHPL